MYCLSHVVVSDFTPLVKWQAAKWQKDCEDCEGKEHNKNMFGGLLWQLKTV